jgi:hypothetical protein
MTQVALVRAGRKSLARKNRERGAALIESAIVLPVLLVLVIGIIEIGFLVRSASVANSSTRSGARLAAALYGGATTSTAQTTVIDNVRQTVEKDLSSRGSYDIPVAMWVYKSDAGGNPPSGNFTSCGSPCFTYAWSVATGHFTSLAGTWSSPLACGQTHDSIGVYIRMKHSPIGFVNFVGSMNLDEHTVMRLEPRNSCPAGV